VTPSGSGKLEWQSRQEFFVCAKAISPLHISHTATTTAATRMHATESRTLTMQPHFATQP
jgi:hypothetical protein